MSIPEFGEGNRGEKGYRRLALSIGAVVVAIIAVLVILAIVT